MADESRTLGKGGADYSPLFSFIEGRNKLENEKDLAQFQHDLDMRKNEGSQKFQQLMEGIRHTHTMERQEAEFQRGVGEHLLQGQAIADYTGQQAVDQAQGGNVIGSLVERRPELDTPEAGMPGFVSKPIDPRAATVAHGDLMKGIDQKRASELRMREKEQQRLLDSVGPNEITTAKSLVPLLHDHGRDIDAARFDSLEVGGMSKHDFNTQLAAAQQAIEHNKMLLERARTYGQFRVDAQKIASEARLKAVQLSNKARLDNRDLQEVKFREQQLQHEISNSKTRMTMLNMQLANAAGIAAKNLEQQLAEEQNHLNALVDTHNQFQRLDIKGMQQMPMPDRDVTDKMNKALREAMDAIGYKGKNFNELKPADIDRLDNEMRKRGYGVRK